MKNMWVVIFPSSRVIEHAPCLQFHRLSKTVLGLIEIRAGKLVLKSGNYVLWAPHHHHDCQDELITVRTKKLQTKDGRHLGKSK